MNNGKSAFTHVAKANRLQYVYVEKHAIKCEQSECASVCGIVDWNVLISPNFIRFPFFNECILILSARNRFYLTDSMLIF